MAHFICYNLILFYSFRAWFEELRKKRMAELRHALELSEGSIGFVHFCFLFTEIPISTFISSIQ